MQPYDDSSRRYSYTEYMQGDGAHIRLKLDTDNPISLTDFVGSFTGLGSEFERFIGREKPELRSESEIFVNEVRAGCIEADLVAVFNGALAAGLLPTMVDYIDKGQILTTFVKDLQARLSKYFTPGGREPTASKPEISDFMKTVRAIANDPNGNVHLEAATFEDGVRKVRAQFRFGAPEAREAERQLLDHRAELEMKTDADHERVLLHFVRPSVEAGKPGKKGGERAIIGSLHPKALAVLYASDLAERRVRHELMSVEGNVFRKLFDVDVNVEMSAAGKPIAYRITALHAVIDAPDDSEEAA
jgi:hypothetical protein